MKAKLAGRLALLVMVILSVTTPGVVLAALLEMSDFEYYYNGSSFFHDDFEDGLIPAVPPYYSVTGDVGMTESGGTLKMDTALAKKFHGFTLPVYLTAGGSGYLQGVFTDAELSNSSKIGIEIGGSDGGGVYFAIMNYEGNVIAVTSYCGPGNTNVVDYVDNRPVLGFTGLGTLTLRLDISDSDPSDGLFDVLPAYWFASGSEVTLPVIQLPLNLEFPNGGFNCGLIDTAVPIPSAFLLLGSGLAWLTVVRKKYKK